jgi:mannose-1-phosphate guanylyltransferase
MKAFLLAAGNGTRMSPLSRHTPKCLLPIRGVPLLDIWLQACHAAGISDVLINVHAHAGQVRDYLAQHSNGVGLHLAEETQLLGSAGTLAHNFAFVAGEEEFFVLYGDVLAEIDLRDMLCFHRRQGLPATLAVHQAPDPQRCGVVHLDSEGVICEFEEKPAQPRGNLVFSGIMIASPKVIALIPPHRPADIGFHLLPRLVGAMAAYRLCGFLLDIGTPERYQAAQSSWPGGAKCLPVRAAP